jgi:type II secretory pathway predicted ATPase ExeA
MVAILFLARLHQPGAALVELSLHQRLVRVVVLVVEAEDLNPAVLELLDKVLLVLVLLELLLAAVAGVLVRQRRIKMALLELPLILLVRQ